VEGGSVLQGLVWMEWRMLLGLVLKGGKMMG